MAGALGVLVAAAGGASAASSNDWFGIRVVDAQTGRGVPLVELATVNHVRFVTDSGGWVALNEPGWMGQPVFLEVRSDGYAFPKDAFGYAGKAVTPRPGGRAELRVQRVNVAERVCRLTGEGIYRDSVLLGEAVPLAEPLGSGRVAGQDSTLAVPYRGKLYWFWGDTARLAHPLGHFGTAAATSEVPGLGGLAASNGVNYCYVTNADGFSRGVCRLGTKEGLMWVDGVLVAPDETGRERLVAHATQMAALGKPLGHALAVWEDGKEEFTRWQDLPKEERWRFPSGHPVRHREDGREWFYFGDVFPNVRVPAEWRCLTNPASYEALTLTTNASGGRVRTWSAEGPPVGIAEERRWLADGTLKPEEAWFHPVDVATGKRVELHRGSVAFNAHRQRWVAIAVEEGGSSYLGEVWYAEAAAPTGPWRKAVKIVTHANYSFYNPVHHPFFDEGGGRWIYFEGTYTTTFAKAPAPTARYEYNQVLYRLDLEDERLRGIRE